MHPKVLKLLQQDVYIGTSSWKYEGWRGIVYERPYSSIKKFNDECLAEYAEKYTAVGVDHTYYAWPLESTFTKYLSQTPDYFRFGLKATEKVTVWKYPKIKRYGKEAGLQNETFLDAELFRAKFLDPLRPFTKQLGPVMLEFSQFYPGTISSGTEFVERLDRFFESLKNETEFHFAIELRNANWLKAPYFDLLEKRGVSHVFNSWTKMPSLRDQLTACGSHKLRSFITRLLLRPGTKYEEAVEAYSPYDRIQDEQPELRDDAASLIRRAIAAGVPAYVFVNNRCEGSAPFTIEGILERV